jgi:acetyl esterase/lipase
MKHLLLNWIKSFAVFLFLLSSLESALPEGFTEQKDVVYKEVGDWKGLMDLYLPAKGEVPVPVVITIHGGAWRKGSKDQLHEYEFYTQRGFAVANVGYRLSQVAPAPAAVEDVRCALMYLVRNAAELNIDPQQILIYGGSAGGHLALMVGLVGHDHTYDVDCVASDDFRIAGIISKSGISLLYQTNEDGTVEVLHDSAVYEWFGSRKDDLDFAKQLSPITHVSADSPPVLLIHGDADERVPYAQSVEMDARLTGAGVLHRFYTVHGAGHKSRPEDKEPMRKVILEFLDQVMLVK